jgi:hypothetical protein
MDLSRLCLLAVLLVSDYRLSQQISEKFTLRSCECFTYLSCLNARYPGKREAHERPPTGNTADSP